MASLSAVPNLRMQTRLRRPPLDIAAGARVASEPGWPAWPVTVLVVALATPWVLTVGTLALSGYRIVLLAMILPCLVTWLSGKAGKIRSADILLLLFCAWCTLSIGVVHGLEFAVEPAGMLFIETFGAYLLARCYIRTPRDFYVFVRLLFVVVAILLPFALVEALTGRKLILDISRTLLPTLADTYNAPRWGLWRVQGPFEHPILFGVFCSSMLAVTHLVLGRNLSVFQRWSMSGVVVLTAFLSLSAGPLTALVAQGLLLVWNGVLKEVTVRWRILWALALASYVLIDLFSNQSVPAFYISRFAFDVQSAWHRLLLLDYGWASVMSHPFFGVGFNDWVRPIWVSWSIDMFWLVPAMRHGLPAALLVLLAFAGAVFAVGFRKGLDEELTVYRTAYLIVMTGFFLVGWTVHFWNATYVLFMFFLGSGMWLLDADATPTDATESTKLRRERLRHQARTRPSNRARAGPVRAIGHPE